MVRCLHEVCENGRADARCYKDNTYMNCMQKENTLKRGEKERKATCSLGSEVDMTDINVLYTEGGNIL